jgi:hypothetical protein
LEPLAAPAGIDPVAPQQVGLNTTGKSLGVHLALETAFALPTSAVAVADVPADLTRLRDALLEVSHRRRDPVPPLPSASADPAWPRARRRHWFDACTADPPLYLDRVEAHEPTDLQVRNAAFLDQPPYEPPRHAQACRQAVDVE